MIDELQLATQHKHNTSKSSSIPALLIKTIIFIQLFIDTAIFFIGQKQKRKKDKENITII